MTHSAENDAPAVMVWHDEADRLAAWGTLDPPDACMCRECILPPAETGHGLPFDPPEADEPTCPTCGQALFTHGIVGRCTPPVEKGQADAQP